jgi:hypothetical protein
VIHVDKPTADVYSGGMKTITTIKGTDLNVDDFYINGNNQFAVKVTRPTGEKYTASEKEPGVFTDYNGKVMFKVDPNQPSLVTMRDAAPGETKRRNDEQKRLNGERDKASAETSFQNRLTREQYEAQTKDALPDAKLGPGGPGYIGDINALRYAAYATECALDGRKTEYDIRDETTRNEKRLADEHQRQSAAAGAEKRAALKNELASLPVVGQTTLSGMHEIGQKLADGTVVSRIVMTRRANERDNEMGISNGADFVTEVELVKPVVK